MKNMIISLAFLMVAGCSLPKMKAEDFRFDPVKQKCMELGEIMCNKAQDCMDNVDWNKCMTDMFGSICVSADGIGSGFDDCYRGMIQMECTDDYPEACSRAFIDRTTVGGN